jgi:molecular chaperone DnaK
MRTIVGIDLGTTNSAVAAVIDGAPTVLSDTAGRLTTPSVVAFPEHGAPIVGHVARARLVRDPGNTVYSAKRLIGRAYNDPAARLARAAFPYEVVSDPSGQAAVKTRQGTYSIVEISAMILRHMAAIARERLGGTGPVQAVLTVPANFNDAQREYTRVAGRIAGLEVLRIVNEPTAAALAFGFGGQKDGVVAVYDFGGGTFDISFVEIKKGVYRVLATAGDPFLGGDDIDVALAGWAADRFRRSARIDLRRSQATWQRLLFACEQAKCELADRDQTEIVLPDAGFGEQGATELRMNVGRADLASSCYQLVERSMELVRRGMQAARLEPQNITDVVLVGGTTRIPLVIDAVAELFGRAPLQDVDPLHAVALGGAVHAALLNDIPVRSAQESKSTTDAALLLDVLPHSIGIAVAGGGVEWILKSNSVIPTEETRRFTTWRDGQTELRFVLLQGDSPKAAENTRLGDFVVDGLRPAPLGTIGVEVDFEVDVNGILCVTARDLDSGRVCSRRLQISAPTSESVAEAKLRLAKQGGEA